MSERAAYRTRHLAAQAHYSRELIEWGIIKLHYVPSADQLADYLTKTLTGPKFSNQRDIQMKTSFVQNK